MNFKYQFVLKQQQNVTIENLMYHTNPQKILISNNKLLLLVEIRHKYKINAVIFINFYFCQYSSWLYKWNIFQGHETICVDIRMEKKYYSNSTFL